MVQKWVALYEYEGYEISNTGKIRSRDRTVYHSDGKTSFRRGKELKPRRSKTNPHLFVSIKDQTNGIKRKTIILQRAVADHFVRVPSKLHKYSSNISGDYDNNRADNIMWITHKQLMNRQPKRKENPTKAWETRRAKYGNSWGSKEEPKWNPQKAWETRRAKINNTI